MTIDKEVEYLTSDIHAALTQSCPLKQANPRVRQAKWWTQEVADAKSKWQRASNAIRAQRVGTEAAWAHATEMRREYKWLLQKVKRQSWQAFCNDMESQKGMSLLNKAIQRKSTHVLGQLKLTDGTLTATMGASLEALFGEHFPGCRPPAYRDTRDGVRSPVDWTPRGVRLCELEGKHDFITSERIKLAIAGMAPHKAAGPDAIKNKVLQMLDHTALQRLLHIYRAMLLLGYTPRRWRESKVVYT